MVFNVSEEVLQSIRLFNSSNTFGQHQIARVVIFKVKEGNMQLKPHEITFVPIDWYHLVIYNRDRINSLIDLLKKEASLAANKRKQDSLAAGQSLFKATWPLPSLQNDHQ